MAAAAVVPIHKQPFPCPPDAPHYDWAKYLYDGPWAALFELPKQGRSSMQLANSGWLRTSKELEAAIDPNPSIDPRHRVVKYLIPIGDNWGAYREAMYRSPIVMYEDGTQAKDRTVRIVDIYTDDIEETIDDFLKNKYSVNDIFTAIPQIAYSLCASHLYGGYLPHVLHPIHVETPQPHPKPFTERRKGISLHYMPLSEHLLSRSILNKYVGGGSGLTVFVDIFIQMVRGVMELYSVGLVHTNPDPANFLFTLVGENKIRVKLGEFDWVHVHPGAYANEEHKRAIDNSVLRAPTTFPPDLEHFKLSDNDFGGGPATIEQVLCARLLLSFSILCVLYGNGVFTSVKTQRESATAPAVIELGGILYQITPSDKPIGQPFKIFDGKNCVEVRRHLRSLSNSDNKTKLYQQWSRVIGSDHKSLAELLLALQDLYALLGDNTPGCKRVQGAKTVVALADIIPPSFFSFHVLHEAGVDK